MILIFTILVRYDKFVPLDWSSHGKILVSICEMQRYSLSGNDTNKYMLGVVNRKDIHPLSTAQYPWVTIGMLKWSEAFLQSAKLESIDRSDEMKWYFNRTALESDNSHGMLERASGEWWHGTLHMARWLN